MSRRGGGRRKKGGGSGGGKRSRKKTRKKAAIRTAVSASTAAAPSKPSSSGGTRKLTIKVDQVKPPISTPTTSSSASAVSGAAADGRSLAVQTSQSQSSTTARSDSAGGSSVAIETGSLKPRAAVPVPVPGPSQVSEAKTEPGEVVAEDEAAAVVEDREDGEDDDKEEDTDADADADDDDADLMVQDPVYWLEHTSTELVASRLKIPRDLRVRLRDVKMKHLCDLSDEDVDAWMTSVGLRPLWRSALRRAIAQVRHEYALQESRRLRRKAKAKAKPKRETSKKTLETETETKGGEADEADDEEMSAATTVMVAEQALFNAIEEDLTPETHAKTDVVSESETGSELISDGKCVLALCKIVGDEEWPRILEQRTRDAWQRTPLMRALCSVVSPSAAMLEALIPQIPVEEKRAYLRDGDQIGQWTALHYAIDTDLRFSSGMPRRVMALRDAVDDDSLWFELCLTRNTWGCVALQIALSSADGVPTPLLLRQLVPAICIHSTMFWSRCTDARGQGLLSAAATADDDYGKRMPQRTAALKCLVGDEAFRALLSGIGRPFVCLESFRSVNP